MTDTVALKGITARGYHGVLGFERELGQAFVVDVQLSVDVGPAAEADDLRLTVDYGAVATAVVDIITGPPFDLIETLAVRIAQRVRQFDGVEQATVAVHKPYAPVTELFSDVVVTVTR